MKFQVIREFFLMTLFQRLLLASPTPQNYGTNSRNLSGRNNTVARSRKVDGFDNRQIGNGDTASGCNEVFCESDPNYPNHIIRQLERDLEKFEHLFGDDYIDNVALRFDSDEQGLCQSKRRLIHPKRGMTASGTWLTIINNDDKYRQGILVEECSNQYSRCDYSENFPYSVHSTCKQNFMYRSLLAIGPDNKPIMEHFQFPSCCKCFVTVGHRSNQPDSTSIRFGGSSVDEKRKRSDERYVLPY